VRLAESLDVPLSSSTVKLRPLRERTLTPLPATGRVVTAPAFEAPPDAAPFLPIYPARWIFLTILAAAATAGSGLLIARYLAPAIEWSLLTLAAKPMKPWMGPCLLAGFILYLVSVLFPFLLFLLWGRLSHSRTKAAAVTHWPLVSILIPAHDEQEIILDAIHGALNQRYPNFEVIVIDDGSTDLTPYLAAATAIRLVRLERNRGKAAALNRGLEAARGEVIVTCDADSYLDPEALQHLIPHLAERDVGAVAGQVRLFHPDGWLRRVQVMEYDYGQGLIKQAQWATTGSVLIAPGPVSAFRAEVLRAIGGVPQDTLTEDFDLTLKIIGQGMRVAYEPRARAYTDAPRSDAELRRQRIRWARGGLQVLRKSRHLVGARRFGLVGLFWLPYYLITWFAALPVAVLLTTAMPILIWGSNTPSRFLMCLALYGLAGAGVEVAKIAAGALACDWRDLRFLPYAPLFLIYKKFRLDWFPIEAIFREWRRSPRSWHG
jgi:cellulose synthase/poly-beta-1,6-N-acetylglucosamine synthase-like glycosyltransferase